MKVLLRKYREQEKPTDESEYLVVKVNNATARETLRHFLSDHKQVNDVDTLSRAQVYLLEDSAKEEYIAEHLSFGA